MLINESPLRVAGSDEALVKVERARRSEHRPGQLCHRSSLSHIGVAL
jgi:hypothetical protein